MSDPKVQQEPTIDEILSSIRRIISEDQESGGQEGGGEKPVAVDDVLVEGREAPEHQEEAPEHQEVDAGYREARDEAVADIGAIAGADDEFDETVLYLTEVIDLGAETENEGPQPVIPEPEPEPPPIISLESAQTEHDAGAAPDFEAELMSDTTASAAALAFTALARGVSDAKGVAHGGGKHGIGFYDAGVEADTSRQAPFGETPQQPGHAAAHAVFSPAIVGDIGYLFDPMRRGEDLARHGVIEQPVLHINHQMHHQRFSIGWHQRRPVARHLIGNSGIAHGNNKSLYVQTVKAHHVIAHELPP